MLTTDNIVEILLRSDLDTIKNFCFVNQSIYQVVTTVHFWQQKLNYNHLPTMIFSLQRTVEKIANVRDINIDNKIDLWVELYCLMQQSHNEVKGIVLINQFEKYKDVNMGTLLITLSYSDKGYSVQPIIPYVIIHKESSIDGIQIKILDKDYALNCTIYNCDTDNYSDLNSIIDEKELVRLLTLIVFDNYTTNNNINIRNSRNNTLMDQDDSEYRKGMWDIINWQNNF